MNSSHILALLYLFEFMSSAVSLKAREIVTINKREGQGLVTRNFNVDAMAMLGYGVHSKQLPEHRAGSIRRELEPA